MMLESACDTCESKSYKFEVESLGQLHQLDWRPVIRQILSDRRQDVPVGAMALRFHRGLADAVLKMASLFPEYPVVLCGGVFQNRVLVVRETYTNDGPPSHSSVHRAAITVDARTRSVYSKSCRRFRRIR